MPEPETDKGKRETRSLPLAQANLRIDGDDDNKHILGYAAVFFDGTEGTEYALWADMDERIMPGAFDDVLSNQDDVRGLFNHDPNQILGRTSAGTLKLSVDATGLFYEITPGDTTIADNVIESIRRGDIDGSSFSFRVLDEELKKEDGKYKREITKVGPVYDVGPVTFPAYEDTTSGYRKEELVAAEVRAIVDARVQPAAPPKPDPTEEDAESRKLKGWVRGLTAEKS